MSIQSITGEPATHYIKVVPAELELHPGQTAQLKAYLVWMDGREEDVTEQVRWSTDQPQIGTVTKAGAVTVGVVGSMVVLAQYEDQRTETHIQVTAAEPAKKKKNRGNRKSLIIGGAIVAVTLIINGVALSQMSGGTGESASAQPEPAASKADTASASEGKQTTAGEEPDTSSPPADGDRKDMRASLFGFAKEKAAAALETASSLSGQGKELMPASPLPQLPAVPAETPAGQQPQAEVPATPSPAATTQSDAKAAPPPAVKKEAPPRPKKDNTRKQSTAASTPKAQQPAKPSQEVAAIASQPAAKPTQPKPQAKAAPAVVLEPVQKDGKWGYTKQVNLFDKELAISYQFDHATSFSEGLAVVKKGGKFGYINTEGSLVIGYQYEYATPFQNGVATVKQNGKLIKIDKTGAAAQE
ncbi:WG repeat-containing protein [Brevibacillus borstelensis]|uniref:WG repeat-containing protein n=1 Tax=Brevibacillus borstelensis TaxID=45462 RepID=UPI0030C25DCB